MYFMFDVTADMDELQMLITSYFYKKLYIIKFWRL